MTSRWPALRTLLRWLGPVGNDRGSSLVAGMLGALTVAVVVLPSILPYMRSATEKGDALKALADIRLHHGNLLDNGTLDPRKVRADSPDVIAIQEAQKKLEELSALARSRATKPEDQELLDSLPKIMKQATTCTVDPPTPPGGAPGQETMVKMRAYIPLDPGAQVGLTSDRAGSSGGLAQCLPPGCSEPFTWNGSINLAGDAPDAGSLVGTTTTIRVEAPGLTCPPVTFTWLPLPPTIRTFGATPQTQTVEQTDPPTTVQLVWLMDLAQSASINISPGSVLGADELKAGSRAVQPTQTTTYVLTAQNPAGAAVKSFEVKVNPRPQGAYTVSLIGGGGIAELYTDQATVLGSVSPVPPVSTSVAIGVNGVPVLTVPTDASGQFSATVALPNRITRADLTLSNPSISVTETGDKSSGVSIFNSRTLELEDTKNVIQAAVLPAEGGSNVASVTVFHVVDKTGLRIDWGGNCGEAPETQNFVVRLTAGQRVFVGSVDCGFSVRPLRCTGEPKVTVETTLGEPPFVIISTWTVNIP